MLLLENSPLDILDIQSIWLNKYKKQNLGALITFVGIVREEGDIEALSFDIYKPILVKWFNNWEQKAKNKDAIVLMAHSIGDVKVHQSSYISGIVTKHRDVGLTLIRDFVEDFKANAPIWKYDVVNGKRVYAEKRSTQLKGSGLLA
jgi:molybdopterin synthase catalytic subunit